MTATTHISVSQNALATERYVRGENDERIAAMSTDVPGGPMAFSYRARALTQNTNRTTEAFHLRQSFKAEDFDPSDPDAVQRVNDLGYEWAKDMHPDADCLVVTHVDGVGGHPHNHVLVINHDNVTGKRLTAYRSHKDRGFTPGVQSANDALLRRHGLVPLEPDKHHAPKDWELRREDFADGSLDRQMGDRFQAALADPRATDRASLDTVIAEQNEDDSLPKMRLHSSTRKKGKNAGKETWTLYIEDHRDEAKRSEHRKRCSVLSKSFTAEGAQEIFDARLRSQQEAQTTAAPEHSGSSPRPQPSAVETEIEKERREIAEAEQEARKNPDPELADKLLVHRVKGDGSFRFPNTRRTQRERGMTAIEVARAEASWEALDRPETASERADREQQQRQQREAAERAASLPERPAPVEKSPEPTPEPQQPVRAAQTAEQQQTEPVLRTRRKVQEARAKSETEHERLGRALDRKLVHEGLVSGPRRDNRQLGD